MAERESVELTVMCMVCDGQGNVLVEDRVKQNWPGVTFPGGHVELGESFVEAVVREVREETGLTIQNPRLCGVKQFPLSDGGRYVLLLFRADQFTGGLVSSGEGEVFWVERAALHTYPLAMDFGEMVRVMESEELSEFFYEVDGDKWRVRLL
ncbi:MAG: 8-oxo-dGTP diphosphatase [Oscillospiraceae bacterium]|nr:8-oxo-dGTP diphosphatase [Oscillospiraceae bacterium]